MGSLCHISKYVYSGLVRWAASVTSVSVFIVGELDGQPLSHQ